VPDVDDSNVSPADAIQGGQGEPQDLDSPAFRGKSASAAGAHSPTGEDAPFPQIDGYTSTRNVIGRGGQGVIWRGVQKGTNRDVAIKVLKKNTFATQRAQRDFEREVKLLATFEHPHIARVYESGVHKGNFYYAMELINGKHLHKYVWDEDLTLRETLELMQIVCEAVQFAHQKGIIHRDLKPSNILVDSEEQPHVMDFGLAIEETADQASSGYGAGTLPYMSPEQAAYLPVIAQTDVYSLGVILYVLLTGRHPHGLTDQGAREFRDRIANGEVIPPRTISKEIIHELEVVILKALAKDPDQRYASAEELAQNIANYLDEEPRIYREGIIQAGYRCNGYRCNAEEYAKAREWLRALQPSRRGWEYGYLMRRVMMEDSNGFRVLKEKSRTVHPLYGNKHANAITFSPDGKCLVTAGMNGTVTVWDVDTESVLRTFPGRTGNVPSIAFSPDGKRLATSDDEGIRVRNTVTGQDIHAIDGEPEILTRVTFSPDGKHLACVGEESTDIILWDAVTGKELLPSLRGHSWHVLGIAFSPDGDRLASGSMDHTVKVWNVATREELHTFEKHAHYVCHVTFLADGKRLASSSIDGTIKIWDVDAGRELRAFSGRVGQGPSIDSSPDGKRLVTVDARSGTSEDIRIWDTAIGQEVYSLYCGDWSADSAIFSPDGMRVAALGKDGTIRIWEAMDWTKSPE